MSLPDDAASLVAMPIVPTAEKLKEWSNRRSGKVPELGSDPELYRRIEAHQPYRSLAVVTAVSPDFERFGASPAGVNTTERVLTDLAFGDSRRLAPIAPSGYTVGLRRDF